MDDTEHIFRAEALAQRRKASTDVAPLRAPSRWWVLALLVAVAWLLVLLLAVPLSHSVNVLLRVQLETEVDGGEVILAQPREDKRVLAQLVSGEQLQLQPEKGGRGGGVIVKIEDIGADHLILKLLSGNIDPRQNYLLHKEIAARHLWAAINEETRINVMP